MKWFVGKGPRPNYGRWTYWEKFDYLAVFWGVAIIGFSGLVLWFPVFFTKFFPGWVINVSQIIHSDEALLAVGFIFTVHFFNTHFRPEAFPMDTVIFYRPHATGTFQTRTATGISGIERFRKTGRKNRREGIFKRVHAIDPVLWISCPWNRCGPDRIYYLFLPVWRRSLGNSY